MSVRSGWSVVLCRHRGMGSIRVIHRSIRVIRPLEVGLWQSPPPLLALMLGPRPRACLAHRV